MSTLTDHLNQAAPYPTRVKDVTAASLSKALAGRAYTRAQGHLCKDTELTDDQARIYILNVERTVLEYAFLEALAAVTAHAGRDVADELAASVWAAWDDGLGVYQGLYQHARIHGLDPAALTVLAEREAATARKAAA